MEFGLQNMGIELPLGLLVRDAGIAVLGWFLASLLSRRVYRTLVARGFDDLFIPPWEPTIARTDEEPRYTASFILRIFTYSSIALFTGWLLARLHHVDDIQQLLWNVLQGVWMIGTTVLAGLAAGRLVASAILKVLTHPSVYDQWNRLFPVVRSTKSRLKTDETFVESLGRVAAIGVYCVVFLPVLMVAAEVWGWNATGQAVSEVWAWFLPFGGTACVVLIGWMVVTVVVLTWFPAEKRHQVVAATTVLAVFLLAAAYSPVFSVLLFSLLLVGLWTVRRYLSEVAAGFALRMERVRSIPCESGKARVLDVGLLTSQLQSRGQEFRVRNRELLTAHLESKPLSLVARFSIESEDSLSVSA